MCSDSSTESFWNGLKSNTHTYIYIYTHLFIYLFIYVFIYLCIYVFSYLWFYDLFIYVFIHEVSAYQTILSNIALKIRILLLYEYDCIFV